MGKLREKAEAEVETRRNESLKRAQDQEQYDRERHREIAGPAAKWLSNWSGEEVNPDALRDVNHRPPGRTGSVHRWAITLDGFELELEDTGHPPNSDTTRKFTLLQRIKYDGKSELRDVETPADLLASPPVSAP